jgi:hypothetical protein
VLDDSLTGLANAQVELKLDPKAPSLAFGIIGELSTQSWWSLFTSRFGTVSWRSRGDQTVVERSDTVLEGLLDGDPVDVVLMKSGRVRSGSLIWQASDVMVVLSLDGWRSPPPSQWKTRRMNIRHDQLGGVTEGEFTVHVAFKGDFAGFNWCENLVGVPAKLGHMLECTGTGKKVPIPLDTPKGWTQDG